MEDKRLLFSSKPISSLTSGLRVGVLVRVQDVATPQAIRPLDGRQCVRHGRNFSDELVGIRVALGQRSHGARHGCTGTSHD